MTVFREIAAAKINLALHVTGRRDDGYHLLDTLVTFAGHGDVITVEAARQDEFTLSGRFAGQLQSEDPAGNLVIRARDLLRTATLAKGLPAPSVAISLQKNLPIASGIGGGSADAAATLRALQHLWESHLEPAALEDLALKLGADVPMCLASTSLRATGIGEDLTPLPALPRFGLLLGNPLQAVSTPAIFKAMTRRDNPPIGPLPTLMDQDPWIETLRRLRNDLQPAAETLCPHIAELSRMIEATGALVTRMSGSGATCFGLYPTYDAAFAAEKALLTARPDWYFQASQTL
ncbi:MULTISPECIES: 4-(cytidine 5'-diphospho)-2-C-methyl-D-erythritol kinase [Rhizobium/Agrobacterium group]|uniref:4-diphosphocytidyl-2-C-methyl-D-erythritol kinase n=2 Tax=Rhizobium/Agrobacterium group TaxID=227290 RepID=B9JSG7_ALLAM|nr:MULTISPECIES: 4-(cytidine 5'-diphospho)-2-C-methyl-D-erythritol kinase [Rhizobium/Agrobacterium group]ACM35660.1 4-diphosphocytidyl-2C-methyl-D-erythritol kinase [Allorhizobium ampelinum S4]MCF1447850.1 4-(cytidine 5'-diphospho)-2-C-methyl-D-erythritol kinase [Allorhizobium ampelinum]MCF1493943.1 4-(cytidine 5'-diphospho)-2-C-methyl-D-erythritol kinase [Allorhizobium ampelinum]MUO29396.1 4-(cytidine 5'-diphospho)-2-C-methyl-D-erythritol kinase [Agrobacterium vitis]MUO42571.1 4-(cytidine 5'-